MEGILVGIITGNLIALNALMVSLRFLFSNHKKQDQVNWKNLYRKEILEFYNRIIYHGDKEYPPEMYLNIFEMYEGYKKLGGNSYVDDIMVRIREKYNRQIRGKEKNS